jgi:tetratricopeptide (TPR) repeat protein
MNQEKRYAEALGYFEAALESSPRFALAWINKGIALKNLSRLDEAIACYDKVICEIDSHFKKAWHNRAVALILKGDLAGASVCLETALQIDPDYTVAWALRARLEELL